MGDKPLPEPMMTLFSDVCLLADLDDVTAEHVSLLCYDKLLLVPLNCFTIVTTISLQVPDTVQSIFSDDSCINLNTEVSRFQE